MKRYLLPSLMGLCAAASLLLVDCAEGENAAPRSSPTPHAALWESLIEESLAIADEADPLRRASGSAKVADELAAAVAKAAARGDEEQVVKLTRLLSEVMERGIRGVMVGIDPADLEPDQQVLWMELTTRPDEMPKAVTKQFQQLKLPHIEFSKIPLAGFHHEWEKWVKKDNEMWKAGKWFDPRFKGKPRMEWGNPFFGKDKGRKEDFKEKGREKKGKKGEVHHRAHGDGASGPVAVLQVPECPNRSSPTWFHHGTLVVVGMIWVRRE